MEERERVGFGFGFLLWLSVQIQNKIKRKTGERTDRPNTTRQGKGGEIEIRTPGSRSGRKDQNQNRYTPVSSNSNRVET
jgi:hypothetical protein